MIFDIILPIIFLTLVAVNSIIAFLTRDNAVAIKHILFAIFHMIFLKVVLQL